MENNSTLGETGRIGRRGEELDKNQDKDKKGKMHEGGNPIERKKAQNELHQQTFHSHEKVNVTEIYNPEKSHSKNKFQS